MIPEGLENINGESLIKIRLLLLIDMLVNINTVAGSTDFSYIRDDTPLYFVHSSDLQSKNRQTLRTLGAGALGEATLCTKNKLQMH